MDHRCAFGRRTTAASLHSSIISTLVHHLDPQEHASSTFYSKALRTVLVAIIRQQRVWILGRRTRVFAIMIVFPRVSKLCKGGFLGFLKVVQDLKCSNRRL